MSAKTKSGGAARGVERHLAARYRNVRDFSFRLSEVLSAEDCAIQSMPDVSPTRWHLAHTTWFFETFVLKTMRGYQAFRPEYEYLYNSYYNTVGEQYPRARRGLLSRPGLEEILDYRRHVDSAMGEMLEGAGEVVEEVSSVVEVGLNHEQQHQELLLTDIKHVLSCNPLAPVYREGKRGIGCSRGKAGWRRFEEGIRWVGHEGEGFSFDNEGPRHRVFLEAFEVRDRPVTCGEYLEFMKDGGYERPEFWLSMGWQNVREQGWQAPLYWRGGDGSGGWRIFTMGGLLDLDVDEPVCHVSYFEADAYARWAGARLATEAEWETAAAGVSEEEADRGNYADVLLEAGALVHPSSRAIVAGTEAGFFGDTWEWTASPYVGYPGYQALGGALGEYNGKFMCNQYVLRGGSCATSSDHMRRTYRNFFPPEARWQFSGIRLARGV